MKYFLFVYLSAIILVGSSLNFSQDRSPSAGKVPLIESARLPNYNGDGSNLAVIAYGISSIRNATLSIPIPSGSPLDSLNSWVPPNFASSMTKGGNGRYYVTVHTPALYEFTPSDGNVTLFGNITGMIAGDLPNGISYNPANGQYYIASSLNLYSFNVTSRVATLIGPFNSGGGLMIDLAFDCDGVCYAFDLLNDNAYTINISTGSATLLGALGYDANFGQGMSIDHETGSIYLSAFNNTTFTGQLRRMNASNGSTTLIVDWGFEQIAPFAIDVSCAPDPPTLQSPSNGATGISTNPTLTWNASQGATSYGLQISLNSAFSYPSFNFDALTVTSFMIPVNLPANTTFFWRVNASNSNGTSAYSTARNFTTVTDLNLSQTISFPNKTNPKDYSVSDYKIVGLPGDSALNVSTLLSGSQGTDWEVYWDNGDDIDYIQKFNSSSPFRFSAGSAYWIIRKGNLVINQTVPAARVNASGLFEIPLHSGFNLITNPFTVPVSWDAVKTANGLVGNPILYSYSGGFGSATTMQPYTGYLFENSTSLTTLRIPYPLTGSPLPKMNDQEIWRVNVNMECNEYVDFSSSFGVSLDALESRDIYDHRKPRTIGDIPMVYFYNPDREGDYNALATDIRPEFVNEQVWNLRVNSGLRDKTKLTFSGIEDITADMKIYLIDVDRASYVDLRKNQEYEFIPAKDISDFKIIVGKSEYIDSEINNLMPKEFALGNNFPNPFNPSTTIEVSVPHTSYIRLVIYNILGQELRILFEGTAAPGRYWHVWDGKDQQGNTVPSGIYIYSVKTNDGINISKKMVLMK